MSITGAPSAPLPDNSACPRCGGSFRCGAADPSCACFGLNIGPVLREHIRQNYQGCLCVSCLLALQQERQQQQ